jgi:hypothetical protein
MLKGLKAVEETVWKMTGKVMEKTVKKVMGKMLVMMTGKKFRYQ